MVNCTTSGDPPTYFQISAIIVSVCLAIFGVATNGFILVSFCKVKLLRTVTNYFIVNLAAADILLLLGLGTWVILTYIPLSDEQAYRIVNALDAMDAFCFAASLVSLACVSVDRCLAITRPLRYQLIATHARAVLVISIVWCFAALVFILGFVRIKIHNDFPLYDRAYITSLFVCVFAIPLLVITVSYYRIFRAVWRQLHHPSEQASSMATTRQFTMKEFRIAINILFIILPAYLLWGLLWVDAMTEALLPCPTDYSHVVNWLISVGPHTAASINPIIYISMTRDFRQLFLAIFVCKRKPKSVISMQSKQYTNSAHSGSTPNGIQLVDYATMEERLANSDETKSTSIACVSMESCGTSSPTDDTVDFHATCSV